MGSHINFTVTRKNVHEIPAPYELARRKRAIALYLFLLVPVGCGVQIAEPQMLNAQEVEEWLRWVCEKDREGPLPLKAICAPHIYRIEQLYESPALLEQGERKGCLAGIHMCFISHRGDVFPCGYLPLSAGNLRTTAFAEIWHHAPLFKQLRDSSQLEGRCGACEFQALCGGCRARGYYAYGDPMAEEPYCLYTPARLDPARASG